MNLVKRYYYSFMVYYKSRPYFVDELPYSGLKALLEPPFPRNNCSMVFLGEITGNPKRPGYIYVNFRGRTEYLNSDCLSVIHARVATKMGKREKEKRLSVRRKIRKKKKKKWLRRD